MKKLISWLLWRTGITTLSRRLLTWQKRFVLTFHGISSQKYPGIPLGVQPYLSAVDLHVILTWVGARFSFLTPQEFLETDIPGVLLTFDDGLANNFTQAVPVLEEFSAPAVFFVATQHISNPNNWLTANRRIACQGWGSIDAIPRALAAEFYDGLSETQLAECVQHPLITIGSHTVSHPYLTHCNPKDLRRELTVSKEYLETFTLTPIHLFAYPTGDYNQNVTQAVIETGYQSAFVMDSQNLGAPRYEIPRVGIYNAAQHYLSLKLSGLHRRAQKPLQRCLMSGESRTVS